MSENLENANVNANALSSNNDCPAVAYQAVTVEVPVSITPYANPGNTNTTCCGTTMVVPGTTVPRGVKNGVCNFLMGQNIIVEVPVDFGATASVGDTYVDCLDASSDEINCASLPSLEDEIVNEGQ